MTKKIFILSLVFLFAFSSVSFAQKAAKSQKRTVIKSKYAKKRLLGRHFFSLQWISWKYLGRAYVRQRRGVLYIKGTQKSRKGSDFVKIDGVITRVNRYSFVFDGKITTQVSHNNDGKPCVREGEMVFAIQGKRKYWRLEDKQSPCGIEVDYVDIYFRKR